MDCLPEEQALCLIRHRTPKKPVGVKQVTFCPSFTFRTFPKQPIERVEEGLRVTSTFTQLLADGKHWISTMGPQDLLMPAYIALWLLLVWKFPLKTVNRSHQIGGLVFATLITAAGIVLTMAIPDQLGGRPSSVVHGMAGGLVMFSLGYFRWNRREKTVKEKAKKEEKEKEKER